MKDVPIYVKEVLKPTKAWRMLTTAEFAKLQKEMDKLQQQHKKIEELLTKRHK